MKTFLTPDSARSSAGWNTRGEAEFGTASPADSRNGAGCLTIRIAPGAVYNYPQYYRDFTEDILPGDVFEASVSVRGIGIESDPGAYLAVEFLSGNTRVGIAHGPTGKGNGAAEWEELRVAAAPVPQGANRVRLSLILHSPGLARFDQPSLVRTGRTQMSFDGGERVVRIDPSEVVLERFGGVGFHVFYPCHDIEPEVLNTVILKRWRELNPSFARVTHLWGWDAAKMAFVAEQMKLWQATGTEIYLTTWDPKDCSSEAEYAAYAVQVADMLSYFVKDHGLSNLTTYCLTNELSLNGWGTLRGDLPKFRAYHRAFFEEFQRRELPVRLLATDASPIDSWTTMEWAAREMDDITGVYGGHHYFNSFAPNDLLFYPIFLKRVEWGTKLARGMGKDFIIGEFGCKQDGSIVDGKKNDACIYWDAPEEPWVGIQLAEAAIAAVNAGVYAVGNWTFADFPDEYSPHYRNKWGTFRWSGTDFRPRPHYYAYGLLTRHFRGPGAVFRVRANDPLIRAACIGGTGQTGLAVAAVNRNDEPVPVVFRLEDARETDLAVFEYNPRNPPEDPNADLPLPARTVRVRRGEFRDELPAGSLVVYAELRDREAPGPVTGIRAQADPDGVTVSWAPSTAADLACYRVFRLDRGEPVRIGSTVATRFRDPDGTPASVYRLRAADCIGNVGP